eukprot:10050274-Karenia_brevis.AAC.1
MDDGVLPAEDQLVSSAKLFFDSQATEEEQSSMAAAATDVASHSVRRRIRGKTPPPKPSKASLDAECE